MNNANCIKIGMMCDKDISALFWGAGKQRGTGMHVNTHVHTHMHIPWKSSPAITQERGKHIVC